MELTVTQPIKKKYSTTTAIAKRRAWLRKRIYTYEKRWYAYRRSIARIVDKIRSHKVGIERLDVRRKEWNEIVKLKKSVEEYMEVKLGQPESKIATCIFYKYGMERKMNATAMMKLIKCQDRDQARRWRKSFTRTFESNLKNKEAFYGFKNWLSINSKT